MKYQPPEIIEIINLVRKGKAGENCYGGFGPTGCAVGGSFGAGPCYTGNVASLDCETGGTFCSTQ